MTIPTWGYSKADAKIFDLADGESLPKGYYDSPVIMEEAETKPDNAPKDEPLKAVADVQNAS
jgi:hypothetical protein